MKKLVLILILTFISSSYIVAGGKIAHNKKIELHLKFMGIPICGDIKDFTKKLFEKGFYVPKEISPDGYIDYNSNVAIMNGRFAGDPCHLVICFTKDAHIATGVVVDMLDESSWDYILSYYNRLVYQYKNKYGKIFTNKRDMPEGFYEGCGNEIDAVETKEFNYYTSFMLKSGLIGLQICKGSRKGTARILIDYSDAAGHKRTLQEENKEIINDI